MKILTKKLIISWSVCLLLIIINISGASEKELNVRMSSLRTAYGRVSKPGKSGDAAKTPTARAKWLLKHMDFLRPFVKTRPSRSNLESTQLVSDVDEEEDDDEEIEKLEERPYVELDVTSPNDDNSCERQKNATEKNAHTILDYSPSINKRLPSTSAKPDTAKHTKKQSNKLAEDDCLKAVTNALNTVTNPKSLKPPSYQRPMDEIARFTDHMECQIRAVHSNRRRLTLIYELNECCFRARMEEISESEDCTESNRSNQYNMSNTQIQPNNYSYSIPEDADSSYRAHNTNFNHIAAASNIQYPMHYGSGMTHNIPPNACATMPGNENPVSVASSDQATDGNSNAGFMQPTYHNL